MYMEHLNFAHAPEKLAKIPVNSNRLTHITIVIIWPILLSRNYTGSLAIILKPAFRALVIDGLHPGLHNERFGSH